MEPSDIIYKYLPMLAGFVAAIAIIAAITRWVFSINRQIKNQEAMIWLLVKMARKQGVEKDEIEEVLSYFEVETGAKITNPSTL